MGDTEPATITIFVINISSYDKIIENLLLNKKFYYTYTLQNKETKVHNFKGRVRRVLGQNGGGRTNITKFEKYKN